MPVIGTQMSSAVDYLTARLQIDQSASQDASLNTAAATTPSGPAVSVDTEAAHFLMLKDRIEAGGYT